MTIAMVRLRGHLTEIALEEALATVPPEATALLVDALGMTGYDGKARDTFVAWNARVRDRIGRVAIVTDKPLWRMVITAMGVASRQRMKAFEGEAPARAWLESAGAE